MANVIKLFRAQIMPLAANFPVTFTEVIPKINEKSFINLAPGLQLGYDDVVT